MATFGEALAALEDFRSNLISEQMNAPRPEAQAMAFRASAGVAGIVIGSWPADPGPAERYNRESDLAAQAGVPVLGAVPEGAAALAPTDFRARAAGWIALGLVPARASQRRRCRNDGYVRIWQ